MELIFLLIVVVIITFIAINREKKIQEKERLNKARLQETAQASNHQNTFTKIRIDKKKLEDEDIINHLPKDIFLEYYTSDESYFDIDINIVKAAKQKRDNYRKKTKVDNELYKRRMNAISYEKSKLHYEALVLYQQNIKQAESSESFGVEFFPHDINRVIILLGKLKLYDELRTFLQEQIEKHSNYHGMQHWAVRLTKLNNNNFKPEGLVLNPKERKIPIAGNPTLGAKIAACKDKFPDFNFYFDLPEGMETIEYFIINPYREAIYQMHLELGALTKGIDKVLARAKIAENEEDYKVAIEAHERLIAEEYDGRQSYERLMIIFRKLGWKKEELELIQKGISFYEQRKKSQKAKVLSLARKYGMEKKANEYIAGNKKIHYYNGGFVLYDPCMFLDKWKLRFEKLNK